MVGYSDVTVLNVALHVATGLVTFDGPALLTDFAEFPEMLPYTRDHFLRVVSNTSAAGSLEAAAAWTEEFLDWSTRLDETRPRASTRSPGWTWLVPGRCEGPLMGGCLESLEHLRGTRFWPDWRGRIFFFETSEQAPSPARVDAILSDYENMGVLDAIVGMIVGRPMGYDDARRQALRDVIRARTARFGFPVVTDVDFGHTAPRLTFPLGIRARLDTERRTFELVEGAVL